MTPTTRRAVSLLAAGLLAAAPHAVPVAGPWRAAWLAAVPLLTWIAGLWAPAPKRRAADGGDNR